MSVFYHLTLSSSMHEYDIFLFNYLKSAVNDLLLNKKQKSSKSILVDEEKI